MRRRLLLGLALLPLVAVALALPRLALVPDSDMAPTLLPGDVVLILPGTPVAGDVVAVIDPLDPTRWTLRRVEAVGGAVRYDDGVFRTGGDRTPVVEMGPAGDFHVLRQEGHLVRHLQRAVRWELEERGIPDDAAFVSADARDEALDSRWWGAIPLEAVRGVVRLRVGAPGHAWRGWGTTAP